MEDGRPFCPNCQAPQIKVPVRPPTAPATEPLPPGTPEDVQPPAEPMLNEHRPPVEHNPETLPLEPENKLIWRAAFGAALVAGLLAAIAPSIQIAPLAMLCMFASGGLSVTLYRRRSGYHTVTPWMGAKLGLLTGGWGLGLLAMLSIFSLATTDQVQFRTICREKLQQTIAAAATPDAQQQMDFLRRYIATDRGLFTVLLLLFAMGAAFFLLFSALGGALGAAMFGREGDRKGL